MPVKKKNARALARTIPVPADRRRFRQRLLTWYGRHGRDLPWRKTDDPYHILVSEIMLQQTQVDRVLPKYAEWLDKYPSMEVLAEAPEHDVTRTWYPLGYNIRPKRLQSIARESWPNTAASCRKTRRRCCRSRASAPTPPARFAASRSASAPRSSIPTSRACCFASSSRRAIRKPRDEAAPLEGVGNVMPYRRVFDFNQALMTSAR